MFVKTENKPKEVVGIGHFLNFKFVEIIFCKGRFVLSNFVNVVKAYHLSPNYLHYEFCRTWLKE